MKVIKIDSKNNYFTNSTGQIISKYSPDKKLTLHTDSMLIESDMFRTLSSGLPGFTKDGEEYIVDDGYNTELARAGYIVKGDYDSIRTSRADIRTANNERTADYIAMKDVIVKNIGYDENGVYIGNHKLKFSIFKYGFKYTFIINPVDDIVGYNQQRKELSLPFYPFLKDMDKYRTFYIRVFCQKVYENAKNDLKYETAEEYINILIDNLNKSNQADYSYKFTKMMVKRKINLLNFEG